MGLDLAYLLNHVLLQVCEHVEVGWHCCLRPGLLLESVPEFLVFEGQHAAIGVIDDMAPHHSTDSIPANVMAAKTERSGTQRG